MKTAAKKEIRYGREVFINESMDTLRKSECLCLNCKIVSFCDSAKVLYSLCKEKDLAMAITRCPSFVA